MKATETKPTTAAQHLQTKNEEQQLFFKREGVNDILGHNQKHSFFNYGSNTVNNLKPFFNKPFIQTKLTIGQPGDRYEQEADAMAEQVVQKLSSGSVQRKCAACATEDEENGIAPKLQMKAIFESNEETAGNQVQRRCTACEVEKIQPMRIQRMSEGEEPEVQTKSDTPNLQASADLENRLNASKGSGNPLPEDTRTNMESSFGADFSGVRVHTGNDAVRMNQDLNAQAFTHGNNLYFGAGKYLPGTMEGDKLLAHELTHTIQQGNGVSLKIQRSNPPVMSPSPVRPNAQACLVHLHGDEPNALAVARDLHQRFCVNLVFIDNPSRRLIRIDVPSFTGLTCLADPNRIFQNGAIDAKWDDWNNSSSRCRRDPEKTAAKQAVIDFRNNELNPRIRQCRGQATDANGVIDGAGIDGSLPVVAFHNNRDSANAKNPARDLTINSYLPGGGESSATERDQTRLSAPFAQIQQNPGNGNPAAPANPHVQSSEDVDDFILVTSSTDFVSLFQEGRNVVLQSTTPPQDGSLSVVLSSGRYVNIEAQQGRSSNSIQQTMGEEALNSLGVTPCSQTTSTTQSNTSPIAPAETPVQRKPTHDASTNTPAVQLFAIDTSDRSIEPVAESPVEPAITHPSRPESTSAEQAAYSLADIWDFFQRLLTELGRILRQAETMPQPLPRETTPANLPSGCLTFSNQAALEAQKAHWVSVIAGMPMADVISWLIGMRNPSRLVTTEVERQRDCMFAGMAASSSVNLPSTPRRQWQVSGHRDFNSQNRIWQQKFNFTRANPFDRISDHARTVCGSLLNANETQWNTAEPRHRACWGVSAQSGTTLPSMPAGTRALTGDERQQEILAASSAPGISRHHWGTDMDVFSDQPTDFIQGGQFADEYAWMMTNASNYGFVQTFTLASAFMRLGYMEERWHWSYWPISQALLEFARSHQTDIQTALMAQWGAGAQFSFIRSHWQEYMFNVNETPQF